MHRAFVLWSLVGVLSGVTAGRCAAEPVSGNAPLQPVTLQLKWKHQFQFAGYYAALEQGYYREAGLDVRLEEAPEQGEPSDAVLAGRAQYGIAASDLVVLRSQGKPVVALAAIMQHSPLIFVALKKSGVEHVHDLAGKRVMIEPHAAELLAYLQQEDLALDRLVQLPHRFDISALQRGEVDALSAYSTDEPFLLKQNGLEYRVLDPRAGGIDFYGDTLYTTEAEIRRHPARVRAFVEASIRGWRYALAHTDELVTLIRSKYSRRHSREHLQFEAARTRRLIMPDVVEVGYLNPGRWEHIRDTYAGLGMASREVSLQGFLYERHPRPDLTWVYVSLGGALLVVLAVSGHALRLHRMHGVARREMAERAVVEKQLRSLETRYRVLAEHGPFPIIITRVADGKVRYINLMAARVFDLTQEQAIGLASTAFYVDLEDRRGFVETLNEHGFVRSYELRLRGASGHTFWAALSATRIEFEGEPAAFVALMDISERKALETQLEKLATTDDLTGLSNRRAFTLQGAEELIRAERSQLPLSLLMVDADGFKSINDRYGHEAGDLALQHLSELLRRVVRSDDLPARVGGEEFTVLLPNTDPQQALAVAERLCQMVQSQTLDCAGGPLRMTVSIGVASLEHGVNSLDELVRRADEALFQAKNNGRNRVEAYQAALEAGAR